MGWFRKTKLCFAQGCEVRISPRLLMCRRHWFMVSRETQLKVYATLAGWQNGGSPKPYLDAIKLAHAEVAQAEAAKATPNALF